MDRYVIALVAALLVALPSTAGAAVRVDAGSSRTAATVDPGFLSFAVDIVAVTGGEAADPETNQNKVFPPYDFSRPVLNRLTRALVGDAPGFLRISGTDIDKTYYDMGDKPLAAPPEGYRRVLTRAQWDAANAFARTLGLKVDVGINAGPGPRDEAYTWLADNAREFLEYTKRKGYPLGAVEFGNEPNVFKGTTTSQKTYGYEAPAYARDIKAFDALRRELAPEATFVGPGPFLTPGDPEGEKPITSRGITLQFTGQDPGPAADLTRVPLGPEARDTMPLVPGIYGAVNYHFYPAFAQRCPHQPRIPADPLDPAWLDLHLRNHDYMKRLRDAHNAGAPLWLGEVGSAACGGEVGYSDRHVATFFYLNQLGQLAKRGVGVYVRQALEGGTYGLLEQNTLKPHPDFWATLLWRRLMGPRQLDVEPAQAPKTVRVFGACTPGRSATTLLALNLSRSASERIELRGNGAAEVYRVTAPALDSETVQLNGQTLSAPDGVVPDVRPDVVTSGSVELPPASYAFVVQGVDRGACAAARQPSAVARAECRSRRSFVLHVPRKIDGRRVRSATVQVGQGRARRVNRRTLATRVSLRGLRRGRVRVTIRAKLDGGRTVRLSRTYRTCVRRR